MSPDQLPPSEEQPQGGAEGQEPSAATPEVPMTEGRDRVALAAGIELNPGSLCGSWFHRVENGNIVWDGIVVAEVQPGRYLLQVRKGLEGLEHSQAQVLLAVEQMLARDEGYEFRFYDSKEQMYEAYAEHVVTTEAFNA